jgi:hypothetical protein
MHSATALRTLFAAAVLSLSSFASTASAQCTETTAQNYTGAGQIVCPCFIPNEQAGAVFTLMPAEYPIQILRVGIGWASTFGGAPTTLENAIKIYNGGLPDPGTPAYTLPGPQLVDGFINEFDLQAQLGVVTIASGPFTVTLEFLNSNSGDLFAPSVIHDGNGCQAEKNVVFAIPGGWFDACVLGVTGDWVFYVVYQSLQGIGVATPTSVDLDSVAVNVPTCETITIMNTGCDTLSIAGISGCSSAPFSLDTTMTAHSIPPSGSTQLDVCVTPTMQGPDNCQVVVAHDGVGGSTSIPVQLGLVTAVQGAGAPEALRVLSIHPNPFNPSATLRFEIGERAAVVADVWSVTGERVKVLADNVTFDAGENALVWDGTNARGEAAASGVYYFRVSTRLGHQTVRAVLLK